MQKLSNMSLEKMLEYYKNKKILSKTEFRITNITNIIATIGIANIPIYKVNQLIINSNLSNTLATSIAISLASFTGINIINNIAKGKPIKIYKNYNTYYESQELYKEIEKLYNEILNDLVAKLNTFPINKDPLTISLLLNYLINHGILSYTKKYHRIRSSKEWKNIRKCDVDYLKEKHELEGLYIIAGYGCCRHLNSIIADVLEKMDIKSDKICCLMNTEENINKNIEKYNFKCNHVIIGYIDNNQYHMIDPYNDYYCIYPDENFYSCEKEKTKYIPILTYSMLQSKSVNHTDLQYVYPNINEINEKRKKVIAFFKDQNIIRELVQFKNEHMTSYMRIAYLMPIVLEAHNTNEYQKIKEYRINK